MKLGFQWLWWWKCPVVSQLGRMRQWSVSHPIHTYSCNLRPMAWWLEIAWDILSYSCLVVIRRKVGHNIWEKLDRILGPLPGGLGGWG